MIIYMILHNLLHEIEKNLALAAATLAQMAVLSSLGKHSYTTCLTSPGGLKF
jgi:hypothetical protein